MSSATSTGLGMAATMEGRQSAQGSSRSIPSALAVMLSKIPASVCFLSSAFNPSHLSTNIWRTDCCWANNGAAALSWRAMPGLAEIGQRQPLPTPRNVDTKL